MNPRTGCGLVLLVIGLVLVAGCTQNPVQSSPVTSPAPQQQMTESTVQGPAPLVTAMPVRDLAALDSDGFHLDPSTGSLYEYKGEVLVYDGVYSSVVVFLRYPDGKYYGYSVGGMGGSNATKKAFYLYPDSRYQSMTPEYYIRLDKTNYTASYRNDNGNVLRVATTESRVTP